MSLSLTEKQELTQAAQLAARQAYAPYSQFRVGAAVLGENKLYIGVNVENASYGLALCAERAALASAIAQGEKNIKAIAIACLDAKDVQGMFPCGACRQWMAELAKNAEIIIVGSDRTFTLDELLPFSFELHTKLSNNLS